MSARAIPSPIGGSGRESLPYESVLTRLSFYALTITEREVLRAYLLNVRSQQNLFFAHVRTLADLTRLSERTVQRAIATLRKKNILELVAREDRAHYRGRTYRFNEEKLRVEKRVQRIAARASDRLSTGATPCRTRGDMMSGREVKPKTSKSNTGASRSQLTYAERAKRFATMAPQPTNKFFREVENAKSALAGSHDFDAMFKRLVIHKAELCRIPIPIALALWDYTESECAEFDTKGGTQ